MGFNKGDTRSLDYSSSDHQYCYLESFLKVFSSGVSREKKVALLGMGLGIV